jgi:hypothetical protein
MVLGPDIASTLNTATTCYRENTRISPRSQADHQDGKSGGYHSLSGILTEDAQGLEGPAFILSALTATGGIIGYARTGSLPSVIAGCTVGALCELLVNPAGMLSSSTSN